MNFKLKLAVNSEYPRSLSIAFKQFTLRKVHLHICLFSPTGKYLTRDLSTRGEKLLVLSKCIETKISQISQISSDIQREKRDFERMFIPTTRESEEFLHFFSFHFSFCHRLFVNGRVKNTTQVFNQKNLKVFYKFFINQN